MIKDTVKFREELNEINNWWVFEKVKELEDKNYIKRRIFNKVLDEIETKRTLIITGPRRVGKTVLIKQIIQQLLSDKIDKRNIIYYSVDDPSLFMHSDNLIKDLADYFLENVSKDGKKYIFLDEIHTYKDWYKWIKSYYDRHDDVKFILSGSSSLKLQVEANKYLKGRVITLEMFPLDFKEFLLLSNIRSDFKISFDKIEKDMKKLDYFKIKKLYSKIKSNFNQYLLVGGFPEWFEIKKVDKWFLRLIEDIPKKAIYEDMSNLFNIRNTRLLEELMTFIISNQSRILSHQKMSDVVKLDRNTTVNYVEYLKSSYIIVEILKYAKNVKEQLRSMKKYLCIDQGLRNALMKDYEISESNLGFIIENIIGLHLFKIAKKRDLKLFYFRNNGEIDFVVKNEKFIPIEVKYRETIKNGDLRIIKSIVEENKLDFGIVVTKNEFKFNDKILFIPAWLFLFVE